MRKPTPVRLHRRCRRPGGTTVRRRYIVLQLFAASRQSVPRSQRPTLTDFAPHYHSLIDLPQAAHLSNPRVWPCSDRRALDAGGARHGPKKVQTHIPPAATVSWALHPEHGPPIPINSKEESP